MADDHKSRSRIPAAQPTRRLESGTMPRTREPNVQRLADDVRAVQAQKLRTGQSTEEAIRELFECPDERARTVLALLARAVDAVYPPSKS